MVSHDFDLGFLRLSPYLTRVSTHLSKSNLDQSHGQKDKQKGLELRTADPLVIAGSSNLVFLSIQWVKKIEENGLKERVHVAMSIL